MTSPRNAKQAACQEPKVSLNLDKIAMSKAILHMIHPEAPSRGGGSHYSRLIVMINNKNVKSKTYFCTLAVTPPQTHLFGRKHKRLRMVLVKAAGHASGYV